MIALVALLVVDSFDEEEEADRFLTADFSASTAFWGLEAFFTAFVGDSVGNLVG